MAARLDTGESPTDGNADPRMFFMAFAACKLNREEIERKMCGKKVNSRDRYDLNSSETVGAVCYCRRQLCYTYFLTAHFFVGLSVSPAQFVSLQSPYDQLHTSVDFICRRLACRLMHYFG